MKNKLNKNKLVSNALVVGAVLLMVILSVVLISALTDNEKAGLQAELDNLTSYLNDNNYAWLVNYSLDNFTEPVSKVQVFREKSNDLLATFNINNYNNNLFNKYQIFLTNLNENESYATFDLKSFGNIDYDYVVDPTVYGIPKGMNLLNNSYGTLAGISGRVGVVAIPYNIYLIKVRIDELRGELNGGLKWER